LFLVFVLEFPVDEYQHIAVFHLGVVHQERLLGVTALLASAQVPLPQVLGAGEDAVGAQSRARQRFLHVRTCGGDGPKFLSEARDHDADSVDVEFLQGVLGDLVGGADPFPAHWILALSFGFEGWTDHSSVAAANRLASAPGRSNEALERRQSASYSGQCEPLSRRRVSRRVILSTNFAVPFSSRNLS